MGCSPVREGYLRFPQADMNQLFTRFTDHLRTYETPHDSEYNLTTPITTSVEDPISLDVYLSQTK